MILALNIENVALIDKAHIQFEEGFNVLTGETGAGKSIVIDSMFLLLGGRANKEIIRSGEEKAIVEGIFLVDSNKDKISIALEEAGLKLEDDDTLIVNREITSNGRNYCRINGRIVPLSFLEKIGSLLVDILGQHEHQFLLDSSRHISLLDSFADREFYETKAKLKELLGKYHFIEKELSNFYIDDTKKMSMIDLLKFQINEIEQANLSVDEEKKLYERKNILANSEKLYNYLSSSYKLLYEGSNGYNSILDNLNIILKNIELSMMIDTSLKKIKETLENVIYSLEDCSIEMRNYINNIDFNEESLNEIEKRLEIINDFKRKYGPSIEYILELKEKKRSELQNILNSEEKIRNLKIEQEKIKEDILRLSEFLHDKRKHISAYLEKNINKILTELNMSNSIFKVNIEKLEEPNENGIDNIEFLISTNIGEPLKPLSKIASGGELSRIMLSLKTILADADGISTLIFDEVDTGISGKTAQLVAEKMVFISRNHQIICVTHLPQIASMADVHYKISKISENNKTHIKIEKLDYNGKINELSRIISGSEITETTLNHSKELIEMAKKFKKLL